MDWQNFIKDIITYLTANFPNFVVMFSMIMSMYGKVKTFKATVKDENKNVISESKNHFDDIYGKVVEIENRFSETTKSIEHNYGVVLADVNNQIEKNTKATQEYAMQVSALVRENEMLRKTIAVLITNDSKYLSSNVVYGLTEMLTERNIGVQYEESKQEEELQVESDNL